MNNIKDSVPDNGNDYEPKISLVADYGKQQKSARDDDLDDERPPRRCHQGKQYVI